MEDQPAPPMQRPGGSSRTPARPPPRRPSMPAPGSLTSGSPTLPLASSPSPSTPPATSTPGALPPISAAASAASLPVVVGHGHGSTSHGGGGSAGDPDPVVRPPAQVMPAAGAASPPTPGAAAERSAALSPSSPPPRTGLARPSPRVDHRGVALRELGSGEGEAAPGAAPLATGDETGSAGWGGQGEDSRTPTELPSPMGPSGPSPSVHVQSAGRDGAASAATQAPPVALAGPPASQEGDTPGSGEPTATPAPHGALSVSLVSPLGSSASLPRGGVEGADRGGGGGGTGTSAGTPVSPGQVGAGGLGLLPTPAATPPMTPHRPLAQPSTPVLAALTATAYSGDALTCVAQALGSAPCAPALGPLPAGLRDVVALVEVGTPR
jgi:hypothetical protein